MTFDKEAWKLIKVLAMQSQENVICMYLDTTYFTQNLKLISGNIITKYFLLLQIIVHPFLAFGWSMNSATD